MAWWSVVRPASTSASKVVINEGIELAKVYGATDGHKFVNGVLDKLAPELRAAEVKAGKR